MTQGILLSGLCTQEAYLCTQEAYLYTIQQPTIEVKQVDFVWSYGSVPRFSMRQNYGVDMRAATWRSLRQTGSLIEPYLHTLTFGVIWTGSGSVSVPEIPCAAPDKFEVCMHIQFHFTTEGYFPRNLGWFFRVQLHSPATYSPYVTKDHTGWIIPYTDILPITTNKPFKLLNHNHGILI